MSRFSAYIRQHDTNNAPIRESSSQQDSQEELPLDAIIVPASRSAHNLDHAVSLALHTGSRLIILCTQRLSSELVRDFLAKRSFTNAIAIDLPRDYSHELLSFPGLLSLKNDLPLACKYYVTDLSMKRNLGLVLARMMRWEHIFFLDDDIRDIRYPDLQSTVNMLSSYSVAGMWVTNHPDNSIVCHANRATGEYQGVFASGAALAVNCAKDIAFFPDIYNEDWLFFFDQASSRQLVNSHFKATQLKYDPFADPQRAAWQEFGDVLAEGLYRLLRLGLGTEEAKSGYWSQFLDKRRGFLVAVIERSQNARSDIRANMRASLIAALKTSYEIEPSLCERYIRLWRQDLMKWKERMMAIPEMPSFEAALQEMRLSPSSAASRNGKNRHIQDGAIRNTAVRPVLIPWVRHAKKGAGV